MRKRSVSTNAFLNGLRSVLNIIFPLITFPYVSRILQVNGIGKYNFSQSIVNYFILIASLGISPYAIREGARLRNNKEKIDAFSSQVFSINVVSTVIAYILLFVCLILFYNLRSYSTCILIFSIQIFFTTLGTEWVYSIYEDYFFITIRSIIFQIISILLLFVFVKNENDYLKYAAITVFSSAGANLLNFLNVKKYCRIKLTFHIDWHKHLKPILLIFAALVTATIYINSDVTLLGIMKSDHTVGLYSVSSKIYSIVKTLLASIYIVAVPRLSVYLGDRKMKNYKELLLKVTTNLMLLIIPAMTGLFMLSKNIILILSGRSYIEGSASLQILCFALIFAMLAGDLYECVLIPSRREKYILISTIVSSLGNLILNILLIPFWGQNAAAMSTVVAEASSCFIDAFFSKDLINELLKSKVLRINLLQSFVGCFGIVSTCLICNYGCEGLVWKTIISVVFSVIIYVLILLFLHNQSIISLLHRFKNILIERL